LGDTFYEAAARVNLGILNVVKGDMGHAAKDFRAALVPATQLRSTYPVVSCLDGLAAAEREDETGRAALMLAVSDSLRLRTGPPRSPAEEQMYEPYFTILRKRLDCTGREKR